ncbi:hypothetical protein CROQUDRAFT_671118 [Cronartium quercuum f. sp. fusiforme G11]|uniref:Uncharacterized protein n=1 Tax=Cronartium quercuum f. sp. fusiforme G11 TaxID=708437 RepID=A0A9P6NM12_9BASI|nr:hypothetical protein CROQUDRAFT_671118 [Cronartium quercuum f. sp. fusiforme G11]
MTPLHANLDESLRPPPGCVYSSRPMSVLEWRRSVWLESQLKSPHSDLEDCGLQDTSAVELGVTSSRQHPATHSGTPSRSLARQLSSSVRPSRRPSVRVGPLIDLNQPRDASGRPISVEEEEHRRRERDRVLSGRQLSKSAPKLSSSSLLNPKVKGDQLEARHRAAMRRLQAEADEQIEHAEMLRQRRMTSSHQPSSSPPKFTGSTLLSNSSLDPSQNRYSPTGADLTPAFQPSPTTSPRRARPRVAGLVHKGSAKVIGVVRLFTNLRRKSSKPVSQGDRIEDSSSESYSYIDRADLC